MQFLGKDSVVLENKKFYGTKAKTLTGAERQSKKYFTSCTFDFQLTHHPIFSAMFLSQKSVPGLSLIVIFPNRPMGGGNDAKSAFNASADN